MKTITLSFKILFLIGIFSLVLLIVSNASAQRTTEFGITGSVFDNQTQNRNSSSENFMDSKFGWGGGIYLEENWKQKISTILGFNYYSYRSDINVTKDPFSSLSPYYGTPGEPMKREFNDVAFNYLGLSAGIKYYLTKKLFVSPALEVARALNEDVIHNKTSYNLKLGAGFDLGDVDISLEYSYGLREQNRYFNINDPVGNPYRNKSLQLKLSVPLFKF